MITKDNLPEAIAKIREVQKEIGVSVITDRFFTYLISEEVEWNTPVNNWVKAFREYYHATISI